MILRDKKTVEGEIAYHSIEEFVYNSRGNPFKYRRRHLSVMDTSVACAPDASEAPVTEWQYRYAPHQEREQKRQYASASADELAWIYYLIAPNKKSLSKWHGLEGMNCDSSPTVTLWPVEYNTYGPTSVRILTRPDGSREYPICDYLGSVRFTLHESGKTVEGRTYEPFGSTTSREGEGAGTAYTGVETDTESDLGFHGVRWYDSDWGRFLSVDKLWERQLKLNPYHYGYNNPVSMTDRSGLFSVWDHVSIDRQAGKEVFGGHSLWSELKSIWHHIKSDIFLAGSNDIHLDNMDHAEMQNWLDDGGYESSSNHTLQDFYCHSNFVEVMMSEGFNEGNMITLDEVKQDPALYARVRDKLETTTFPDVEGGRKNHDFDKKDPRRDRMLEKGDGGSPEVFAAKHSEHKHYNLAKRLALDATKTKLLRNINAKVEGHRVESPADEQE